MDAGCAIEGGDAESGIVGQCGKAAGGGRRQRLDFGIADEVGRGFIGFGQAEFAGGNHGDMVRGKQLGDLAQLAGVVGGHDQPAAGGELAGHQAASTALRCMSNNCVVPCRASAMSSLNWASLNGVFSAVPWISTMPPLSVSTKLASASALLSSA